MDLVGQTLGQYQIVEPIGHGGMATVFKAYQPALERHVALKVLLPQQAGTAEFRERFIREAKAVAQLNHPNILPIIDYGQHADLNYIVMKYVSGGTLADRLKHPIELATTARVIAQIAAALDHAHQHGIIHRDIKPSNVLLDEGEWVQLADFGLAKLLHSGQSLTSSGLSMGTPAYLSPEQGQGIALDQRTDIYSLSVILYEMITGRLPFTAETAIGVIVKHIYDQPPPPRTLNPDLPESVQAVVLTGLAKEPAARYASAGDLARALQIAVAAAPTMQFMPVQGSDVNATPPLSPQAGPPTPVVISNKILFEETAPAVPHFVGRAAELAAYHARLEREQFVIITGLAGMGKTTLGARLARDLAASFDNIFWFTFDLVEKYTVDALYWSLASFLDSRGEPSLAKYLRGEIDAQQPLERAARLNLLIAALATGRYVLCFDDFQIVKEVPDIAYIFTVLRQRFVELRQPLPAHFIIIGREVPADLEYLADQTLSGLNSADTLTLLANRGVVLPNELAQRLWQRTGGNPKLLELTIGSLAGLSEADAAAFIASLDQQSNIRDYLLNNVYATLTRQEQLVSGALSVFPGPIERAGLEEVLSEENIGSLTQQLDTLIHKHVLTVTADDYLDCHDLVRAYCYHALNRRERERFHQRAALYFEGERNWLAAAHHQFERRDIAHALELLVTHADAIINSGGAAALSQQLSLFTTPALTAEQRQLLHKTQANTFSIRGDYQAALAAYHTALDEVVAEDQQAELLWLMARAYLKMGDYQSTLDYGSRSLQLSEKSIDDHLGVARAHHDLGWARYRLGYLPQAAQHFKLAEQIAQSAGETLLVAQASMALGVIAWKENRLEEAQQRLETSRRIFREQGSRTEEANAVGNLGLIYQALGDTRREVAHFLQAIDIYDQIGNVHGSLQALGNLGYLYLRQSKWPEAARYYDRLLHLAQDSGQRPMLSVACCGLADCALAQAETRRALDLAIKAREIADEAGTSWELGLTSRVLGDVWLALNDANQAKRYFEESIPILEQHQEAEELARAKKGYQAALAQLGFNSIH